ncbi:CARDB domain-containing protein, partial [Aequorivita marina]|uniref:CARDB domain-containing protein n=1 Tax=Aequorivita marina TaxID=3073654 RepID=UPI0028742ADC
MKRLVFLLLFILPLFTFGQSIELYKQFNGHYGYTAIGNTLNAEENGHGYCDMLSESSATLNLEPEQTVISAHLYWASIGPGDFEISLNGESINAERTFNHSASGGTYFSAYSDVTDLVTNTGNGNYTFSELDVMDIIGQYCKYNFGGWAIYVIYEDSNTELLNQISLFDGLESVRSFNNPINLTLTNIEVTTDQDSKIGLLAWEGDNQHGVKERLYIRDQVISNPPLNPADNAFNGTNSYIPPPENAQNYNMDLDYYSLVGIIESGLNTIDIKLTSDRDWILVNNIITKINSELPDATITIDDYEVNCGDESINVDYTVSNFNSTAPLPANVPIAFYADNIHLGQAYTVNTIPRNGSESGSVNLNIPLGTPQTFTLKAVVDDDGTGNGIIEETNEDNNEFEQAVVLTSDGLLILGDNQDCQGETISLSANFDNLDTYNWFFNGDPYGGNTPTIDVTQAGDYTVSGNVGNCFITESPVFNVSFNTTPVANTPVDLYRCNNGTQTGTFNLTQNDNTVLGGQDPTIFEVKYFTSFAESENNVNAIPSPEAYPIAGPSPQTIYVRIHNQANESCYELEQFEIYYSPIRAGNPSPIFLCDLDGSGNESLNLSSTFDDIVLDGQSATDYQVTYHSTQSDADNGNAPLPNIYNVPVPGVRVFIRIETAIDGDCYLTTSVNITIDSTPNVNQTPAPLVSCDSDNNGITSFFLHNADADISLGNPSLTVTYHYTLLEAQNAQGELSEPFDNIVPYNDEVYARIEGSPADCYATVLLKLEVRDSPVLTEPSPYSICDASNDGYEIFDLTTKENEIRNGLDPLEYDLYFYSVLQEAIDAGETALENPDFSEAISNITNYQNEVQYAQTIYVLGVGTAANTTPNNGAEGCYDIVEMQLVVDPTPEGVNPADYHLCDDTLNGSTPNDQISSFNLTSKDNEVTGGDPQLLVTWFETPADEAANVPIANPTAYQNTSNPQNIVARVSNGFDCKDVVNLTLVVDPVPSPSQPDPIEVCDEGGGFAEFDLSLRITQITNGDPSLILKYYPTEAEAEAGGPGYIPAPYLYTNVVPFNDSVWARVEKQNDSCHALVELELIVKPLPTANSIDPLIACDDDSNGFTDFFLHTADDDITGGDPTLTVTYHYTELDARTDEGELPEPFENIIPYNDEVWARVVGPNTSCYALVALELEVRDSPVLTVPEPYRLCDDDSDGLAIFDLTTKEDEILGGLDPQLYDLYFYVVEQDAIDAGMAALDNPDFSLAIQ